MSIGAKASRQTAKVSELQLGSADGARAVLRA